MRRHLTLTLALCLAAYLSLRAQTPSEAAPQLISPGVWFLLGDASKGYANTIVIEMPHYLIVVDANYPARAKELLHLIPSLSAKPIRYVIDTHAHGDHSYGNSTWTAAGATTLAHIKVVEEMDRYEPTRWHAAEQKRDDVRDLHQPNVERPKQTFSGTRFILRDPETNPGGPTPTPATNPGGPSFAASPQRVGYSSNARTAFPPSPNSVIPTEATAGSAAEGPAVVFVSVPAASPQDQAIINTREVQLLHLGWAHTQGDTFVWLPHERILCTGDAAVNGPRNKLWDANIANWPKVLAHALRLHPQHILPGHGSPGGPEILTGQRDYLIDLRKEVAAQMKQGRTSKDIVLNLPKRDQNWQRPDPSDAIEPTYNELKAKKPAGTLPHTWR